MLLSKLYHSVTQQDQSPQTAAQLLSFPLPLFLYVPSSMLSPSLRRYSVSSCLNCLPLSPLSLPATFLSVYQFLFLSISHYIAFLFPDYCRVNLLFLFLTPLSPSITNTRAETLNWGQRCTIKVSNLIPPPLLPLMPLHLPCHMSTCMHSLSIHVCI